MSNQVQTETAPAGCAAEASTVYYVAPRVDIYETAEGYRIKAEMPGVAKDGFEVSLEANELTLVGRRSNVAPQGSTVLHQESRRADFKRAFKLDSTVDTGRISAKVDQGILVVDLPKAEALKPRRIAVTA